MWACPLTGLSVGDESRSLFLAPGSCKVAGSRSVAKTVPLPPKIPFNLSSHCLPKEFCGSPLGQRPLSSEPFSFQRPVLRARRRNSQWEPILSWLAQKLDSKMKLTNHSSSSDQSPAFRSRKQQEARHSKRWRLWGPPLPKTKLSACDVEAKNDWLLGLQQRTAKSR